MRSRYRRWQSTILTALVVIATVGGNVGAADWPSWRGPNNDGICLETNAPTRWTRTENVRWRIALPEPGNSSPIVWADTIYITQSIKDRRALVALDRRNGKTRWNAIVEARNHVPPAYNNPHCSSSPVTDGERVIVWFGSEGLHAYGLNGTPLWTLDLGPQKHQAGYRSSPVLYGDRVLLNFGPGEEEFIVAADRKTGRELWRARGPTPPDNDPFGTWSTPCVAVVDGKPQVIVALRNYFAGLNLEDGTEIWRCNGMGPTAKASPCVGNGVAIISGGLHGAEIAVRLGGTGDVTETHRLWREHPPRTRYATGVVRDGRLFSPQGNGLIDCINVETGDIFWSQRQKGGGAFSPVWSSPILVGNRLYVVNQAGDTMILEVEPEFKWVAVNRIVEPCQATPAVAYGDLFLRTWAALWCIRPAIEQPSPGPPMQEAGPALGSALAPRLGGTNAPATNAPSP